MLITLRKFLWGLPLLVLACRPGGLSPAEANFGEATDRGTVSSDLVPEASGLVVSRRDGSFLWTHNDSGYPTHLYLLDATGQVTQTLEVNGSISADWEDLAASRRDGQPTLYVADIGNQADQSGGYAIYRLPEPDVLLTGLQRSAPVDKITFRYPGNRSLDAECLLVDHATQDLYVITKEENTCGLYRLPYPQSTTAAMTAELVTPLPYSNITAGDISADNQEIIIKNYTSVYYWKRRSGEAIGTALQRPARTLPYVPEPQGEGLAFATDGKGYYTISERRNGILPKLLFYPRK